MKPNKRKMTSAKACHFFVINMIFCKQYFPKMLIYYNYREDTDFPLDVFLVYFCQPQ